MNSILTYLHESIEELRHVRWPTRQQAIRLSASVLVFTLACAAVFGLVDFGIAQLIRFLLTFQ